MSIAVQQMLAIALELFQRGRIHEADSLAKDLLTQSPASADALHLRGVIAGLQQRHSDAESFLLAAASIDKKNHFIHFNLAKALSEQGKDEESLLWHRSALELDPRSARAWLNYGLSLSKLGELNGAVAAFDRALAINSNLAEGYTNKGHCLREMGALSEALALHNRAVELSPSMAEAWNNRGVVMTDLHLHEEALASYERAVEISPNYAEAWNNRGNVLSSLKRHEEALASYERAIELKPDNAKAWGNRGVELNALRRHEGALVSFERATELNPSDAEAWGNLGAVLNDLKRHAEALASYERAIELKPDFAEAWSNRGISFNDLKRHEEALDSYERAIELKPDFAEAWSNRGIVLNDLKRHEEALDSYERAIELKPDFAEAWSNRGIVLNDLRRHEEALASYERVIELKPDYADVWSNRGVTLNDLRRHEEALASYERAIELNPDTAVILGDLVHTQMKICVWADLDRRCQTLRNRLLTGDRASNPFQILGLFDDPGLQRRCAELLAKSNVVLESKLGPIGRRGRGGKIRVGYFSMDFREHPVAHLIAELIETHDRSKFEIYGFSFGRNTGDSMRKRLEGAFDKFLEVSPISDLDIARLARELEIDIAIDLGGYTQDSRPAIFAHRVASIQINYLGFPGTMGTEHFDYFIGDRITVSDGNLEHFSEKIIFLPNSFQVNPSQRPIGSQTPSRTSYGLPDGGFVFCCFNNVWKITPNVLKLWVSILQKVKGSVLWLQDAGVTAKRNLSRELESGGIGADRIVFAGRLPCLSDHLSRYRLADLFLDTFPYGAHTTASDALWAGLPVLTRSGQSFASRVAGSLLHSVRSPELITYTTEEYETLAIELANNPEKLSSLKAKLAENRTTFPLFNTALFAQHIESGYQAAYDRYHEGLAPDHIYVGP